MSEPKEIIKKYYECPYCELFDSYTKSEVENHMARCGYNPNLPERDCSRCAHAYCANVTEKVGHDRGYRPTVTTRRWFCHLGCRTAPGLRCASYQPNREEAKQ